MIPGNALAGVIIFVAAITAQAASPVLSPATVLGIKGGEFTLNGAPAFLFEAR
jgi:hypothetical protein